METEKAKRQLDMLHGSIWNKLPLFAFPVAATAILEQLFNASDIAVVGNFTGAGKTVAVAAVGANSSIIALIVNLFVGIALGANVVIANAIGRDDREAVKKAVHAGMHGSMISGMLRKKFNIRRSSTAGMWTLRLIAVLLAVCGIYAFAKHKISSYLFLRTQFVFIDFSQPVALVLLDYLAIIALFAMVGYCISKVINKNKRLGNW